MDTEETEAPCAFDTLLAKNVPHILESIFLSLDYKSFKDCLEVNKTWNGLLTSESFQVKAKLVFHEDIVNEQKELWHASMWGKVEVVKRILSSIMVDMNCPGGFNDSTPLCEAASEGHKEVAQLLLQRGAEPDKADKLGQTPLYWAAMTGHRGVAEVLLDGGADPNRTVERNVTPLHQAALKGHTNVVTLLLERGAHPDKACTGFLFGSTPMTFALESGHKEIYRIIKRHRDAKRAKRSRRELKELCGAMTKYKRCVHD